MYLNMQTNRNNIRPLITIMFETQFEEKIAKNRIWLCAERETNIHLVTKQEKISKGNWRKLFFLVLSSEKNSSNIRYDLKHTNLHTYVKSKNITKHLKGGTSLRYRQTYWSNISRVKKLKNLIRIFNRVDFSSMILDFTQNEKAFLKSYTVK